MDESIVIEHVLTRRDELLEGYHRRVTARDNRQSRTMSHLLWRWYSGVYFIEIEGFIKIGLAVDVRVRLRAYDLHSPFTPKPLGFIQCSSEADALALERALHEAFLAHLLRRREWFNGDLSLRAFIKSHSGQWPAPKQKATLWKTPS